MGRQAKMIMQAYHFPTLCFNFQFFLNPPVASQHPPLQREANPHKPLLTALCHCEGRRPVAIHKAQKVNAKTENKKNSMNE